MSLVRPAIIDDWEKWNEIDNSLTKDEFKHKVQREHCFILINNNKIIGVLRYSLLWDNVPFCNFIKITEDNEHKGFGSILLSRWESIMQETGYDYVMVSTQSNESAQHFYRKLGYKDCGGFIIPIVGHEQPLELIFAKDLR